MESKLPTMCNDDIVVGEDIFRFHESMDAFIIKHCGPGHGWKFFKKFKLSEKKAAIEAWREIYNRRELDQEAYSTGHSTAIRKTQKPHGRADFRIPMVEIQKDNGVVFLAKRSIEWHNASIQHAQIAVICAARAGAALNQLKARCEHGQWQKAIKELPFSASTAKNYRNLADQLQQRLTEGGDSIDLLNLPAPDELSDPTYQYQIGQIQQVTGEQTLRQLYFDWGIVKPPAKLGGYHPRKPPELPDGETLDHHDALKGVAELFRSLDLCCMSETRDIIHLTVKELKAVEDRLMSALHNVRTLIKAG